MPALTRNPGGPLITITRGGVESIIGRNHKLLQGRCIAPLIVVKEKGQCTLTLSLDNGQGITDGGESIPQNGGHV